LPQNRAIKQAMAAHYQHLSTYFRQGFEPRSVNLNT